MNRQSRGGSIPIIIMAPQKIGVKIIIVIKLTEEVIDGADTG